MPEVFVRCVQLERVERLGDEAWAGVAQVDRGDDNQDSALACVARPCASPSPGHAVLSLNYVSWCFKRAALLLHMQCHACWHPFLHYTDTTEWACLRTLLRSHPSVRLGLTLHCGALQTYGAPGRRRRSGAAAVCCYWALQPQRRPGSSRRAGDGGAFPHGYDLLSDVHCLAHSCPKLPLAALGSCYAFSYASVCIPCMAAAYLMYWFVQNVLIAATSPALSASFPSAFLNLLQCMRRVVCCGCAAGRVWQGGARRARRRGSARSGKMLGRGCAGACCCVQSRPKSDHVLASTYDTYEMKCGCMMPLAYM